MNLYVTDTNARDAVRVHDILIDGRVTPLTFKPAERLELPEAQAKKFVGIEGFLVEDANKNRILPVTPITTGFDTAVKLSDNQCIAAFEELTVDALLARCAPLPGGEKITSKHGKVAIVAFLVESRKTRAQANMSKEPDIGNDDMSQAELEKLQAA